MKQTKTKRRRKVSQKEAGDETADKQEQSSSGDNTLDEILSGLSKKYKKCVVTKANDHRLRIEKVPFGVPSLDDLLGGGLPVGRIVLMYGEYSTGKTFLAQKAVASYQALGKTVVYVDIDRSFAPDWWVTIGVDLKKMGVLQPMYGEQAWDMAMSCVQSGVDLIVMDSIDLLVPAIEAEASMEDSTWGKQAQMINRGFRDTLRINEKTTLLCINHLREGMGGKFSQNTIPGGKAQQEIASLMMWVAKGVTIKDEAKEKKIGMNIRVMLEKDKIHGKRWQSVEIPFLFEGGVIDSVSGLIELAVDNGIIVQSGAQYIYGSEKFIGKKNVKEYLIANPDIQENIRQSLKEVKDEDK